MTKRRHQNARFSVYNISDDLPTRGETDRFRLGWLKLASHASRHNRRERFADLIHAFCRSVGCPRGMSQDALENAGPGDAQLLRRLLAIASRDLHFAPNALDRRLGWLGDTLGLDDLETSLIRIAARYGLFRSWEDLFEIVQGRHQNSLDVLGVVAGISRRATEQRTGPRSPLVTNGLLEIHDGSWETGEFLMRIARSTLPAGPALARDLMPAAPASTLAWGDFEHLGSVRDLADHLVASRRGSSILVYGPPGTGKTELARLLADRNGMSALFVGCDDGQGQEPSRHARMAHLAVSRALTANDPRWLIVVDEADDILDLYLERERAQRSKIWLNGLVENCQRPTLWIVNDPCVLGEPIVRRMDLAVALDRPPRPIRRKIVERHAKTEDIALSDSQTERLACLPAAPATIGRAMHSAALVNGGGVEALLAAETLVEAIVGRIPAPTAGSQVYDPELSFADTDLDLLADSLARASTPGWNLLLSGPSGTGKSAFAHHVAQRCGFDVIEKRGSDLLGMYVGETEANIASAFREAARSKALLLIDEADDFLSDRREAMRSWERTLVAEMLRWMERLEAPFVATTNLADRLDPATQRRFTLHARFLALDEGRAGALFARYFGRDLPTGLRLSGQTPGDFAQVAHRATLLGTTDTETLVGWLRAEAEARHGGRGVMGFQT